MIARFNGAIASLSIALLCFFVSPFVYSRTAISITTADLFALSLEELLNVEVLAGNLVGNTFNKTPSAITIITQEQLERTPARNLMDILETYVPGLLVTLDTSTGPLLRIRGLGERHFHTLLLVNGKPVNQKAYQGSMVELRNWNMNTEMTSSICMIRLMPMWIASTVYNLCCHDLQKSRQLKIHTLNKPNK
mgnify:CR=1 FL=1